MEDLQSQVQNERKIIPSLWDHKKRASSDLNAGYDRTHALENHLMQRTPQR